MEEIDSPSSDLRSCGAELRCGWRSEKQTNHFVLSLVELDD